MNERRLKMSKTWGLALAILAIFAGVQVGSKLAASFFSSAASTS
jgi:hypothetical protein